MTAILLTLLLITSCNNYLDVKPVDKVGEDELLSTEQGYQKLLNGIYLELADESLYGGALSVEMLEMMGGAYQTGTDASVWGDYIDLTKQKYSTDYWRGRFGETWNKAYSLILNCNKILDGMEEDKELFLPADYNIIRGEAMALRAMLHFDMLRLFGPVYAKDADKSAIPYYKHQTSTPEDILSAHDVMEQVIADLKESQALLVDDPVRTEGTLMSSSAADEDNFMRYRSLRLNYNAVTALLARVCLYEGNVSDAAKYAKEIIAVADNGIYPFVDKLRVIGSPDDPDRIFATEVIFALSCTNRSNIFKNYFNPGRLPSYVFRMDNGLIDNIIYGGSQTGGDADDYRYKACWQATGSNKYFYKYDDMVATGSIENTMVPLVRLGEMYLIAAEAENNVSYINTLRQARGVGSLGQLTPELIIYEYIREMYGEGQLFYLYKRLNHDIINSDDSKKHIKASDAVFCVPLPATETDNRQ